MIRKSEVVVEFHPADGVVRIVVLSRKRVIDDCFYEYRLLDSDFGAAVRFIRIDPKRKASYDVLLDDSGWTVCDCKAGSKDAVRCKHVLAALRLYETGLFPGKDSHGWTNLPAVVTAPSSSGSPSG